jgi:hypothetical protein
VLLLAQAAGVHLAALHGRLQVAAAAAQQQVLAAAGLCSGSSNISTDII